MSSADLVVNLAGLALVSGVIIAGLIYATIRDRRRG
jgi:hypothetical protein